MLCGRCKVAFIRLEKQPDSERAQYIDTVRPFCKCQSTTASPFSPGPVNDNEVLIRLVVAPQHVTKRNTPRSAALSQAESGGLSTFREGSATNEEILLAAQELVERVRKNNQGAGIYGVLMMPCDVVRKSQAAQDAAPAFCVYDTALEKSPAHAEAFQRTAKADKELREARRNQLFGEVVSTFVPVAEFRGGLLMALAPPAA